MNWNVETWSTEIIKGSGGLEDYKYHEIAQLHPDTRIEAAIWTLRCLSNPNSEGSAEALDAVLERRMSIKKEQTKEEKA